MIFIHSYPTGCILRRVDNLYTLLKLKSIDFSNNRLTDTQGLDHITSLESLKLDHNPISRLTTSFVSHQNYFSLFVLHFFFSFLSPSHHSLFITLSSSLSPHHSLLITLSSSLSPH